MVRKDCLFKVAAGPVTLFILMNLLTSILTMILMNSNFFDVKFFAYLEAVDKEVTRVDAKCHSSREGVSLSEDGITMATQTKGFIDQEFTFGVRGTFRAGEVVFWARRVGNQRRGSLFTKRVTFRAEGSKINERDRASTQKRSPTYCIKVRPLFQDEKRIRHYQ